MSEMAPPDSKFVWAFLLSLIPKPTEDFRPLDEKPTLRHIIFRDLGNFILLSDLYDNCYFREKMVWHEAFLR